MFENRMAEPRHQHKTCIRIAARRKGPFWNGLVTVVKKLPQMLRDFLGGEDQTSVNNLLRDVAKILPR